MSEKHSIAKAMDHVTEDINEQASLSTLHVCNSIMLDIFTSFGGGRGELCVCGRIAGLYSHCIVSSFQGTCRLFRKRTDPSSGLRELSFLCILASVCCFCLLELVIQFSAEVYFLVCFVPWWQLALLNEFSFVSWPSVCLLLGHVYSDLLPN